MASHAVGEPITLDHLSAHWRIALATAQQSLVALANCGKSLTFPDQELRERLTRLELERRALAVLLEDLAHEEHVHLRHHLAAPPATRQMLGIPTGIDVQAALAAAEDVVKPFLHRLPFADRGAITQGYAGVYSSFLLHAERAAARYDVPAHEILQRVGEAGYVGGQEDMIIDVALQIVRERECGLRARGRSG